MKGKIVCRDIGERERVFEAFAAIWESAFSTALASLAQTAPSSSCVRLEKTSLQAVLRSFSTNACALEIHHQMGLVGNALFVCRTQDLSELSKLLAKVGTDKRDVQDLEPVQVGLQLVKLAAKDSDRLFSTRHFPVACADPELINPDGNTAGLAPLFPAYEDVICATYRVGAESGLDCHFCLLLDGQLAESLIKMLADSQEETEFTTSVPRHEMAPSSPGKSSSERSRGNWNIDLLLDVELPIAVSFGECEMPLKDVLKLAAGSVIELDKSVNDPVTLIVNQKPIAKGEVVMVDGNYGIRITEVQSTADRIRSLG